MPSAVFEPTSQQTRDANLCLSPHGQRDGRGKVYYTLFHNISLLICYYRTYRQNYTGPQQNYSVVLYWCETWPLTLSEEHSWKYAWRGSSGEYLNLWRTENRILPKKSDDKKPILWLTMKTRHSSEASETDYPAAWHHIPQEESCEQRLHANLKSRRSFVLLYASPTHYCGDQIKETFSSHEED